MVKGVRVWNVELCGIECVECGIEGSFPWRRTVLESECHPCFLGKPRRLLRAEQVSVHVGTECLATQGLQVLRSLDTLTDCLVDAVAPGESDVHRVGIRNDGASAFAIGRHDECPVRRDAKLGTRRGGDIVMRALPREGIFRRRVDEGELLGDVFGKGRGSPVEAVEREERGADLLEAHAQLHELDDDARRAAGVGHALLQPGELRHVVDLLGNILKH